MAPILGKIPRLATLRMLWKKKPRRPIGWLNAEFEGTMGT
jgi:hypothetical protein